MTEHATLPVGTTGPIQHSCGQVLTLEAVLDQDDITTIADIPLTLRGQVDVAHLPAAYRQYNRCGVLLYWWHGNQEVQICPQCGQALPPGRALLPAEYPSVPTDERQTQEEDQS